MALEAQIQQQQQLQLQGHVGGGASICGSSIAGLHRAIPITLDLFHSNLALSPIELGEQSALPLGWQKFLDLKSGEIYYTNDTGKGWFRDATMSRNGKSPKLDLKLNLSPPRANPQVQTPNRRASLSPTTSPPSSCVSSELNPDETVGYSNSPEATSMVLVGCPRCLMYVMLSEEDPKCPKCKSTVLLDFLHDNTKKTRKS
ncbi:hypothetical protein HHK36_016879 [Tetracentron sinense]|uniref:GIR1-like zinc ribbon domain-containing protein n=1 Tax=Tetracentron sinense TaxID=13715 RepID=A0A835DBC6_TETSI|nr:hypothetical protein HHK36_016879 [Tetracentron sinense]